MHGRADTRQRGFAGKGIPAVSDQIADKKLDSAGGLAGLVREQIGRVVVQHRGVRVAGGQERVRHLRHVLRKSQTYNRRHGRSDVAQVAVHADAHVVQRLLRRYAEVITFLSVFFLVLFFFFFRSDNYSTQL